MRAGSGSIPAYAAFDLGLNLSTQKSRKREFLEQMQQVVPWKDLVTVITPYTPEDRKGRPPFPAEMPLFRDFCPAPVQFQRAMRLAAHSPSGEPSAPCNSQEGRCCTRDPRKCAVGPPDAVA